MNKSKHIIAVGYELPRPDEVIEFLRTKGVTVDDYNFADVIKSGVFYDKNCRGGIQYTNATASQTNMKSWYDSKIHKTPQGIIKTVWVMNKPKIIICNVIVCSMSFLSVIAKPSARTQTTLFKKMALSNKIDTVYQISPSIKITLKPYCYRGASFARW